MLGINLSRYSELINKYIRQMTMAWLFVFSIIVAPSAVADNKDSKYEFSTIEPGVLTVAITSYMPYAGLEKGELTGLDGDLVTEVAKRLGLKVKPQLMDFAGILAAVQSNRADMAVGSIGWSEERQKAGLFTDSPYYSEQIVLVRKDAEISNMDDLEGLTIATGIGYSYIPAIQEIPGAKLRTYPTPANMLEDLLSNRVDAVVTDALLNIAYAKRNPGAIKPAPMDPLTDEQLKKHPNYKYFFPRPGGFYINNKNKGLERATTSVLRDFYNDGTTRAYLEKWGVENVDKWLTPSANVVDRIGVDRPANWIPPS